MIDDRTQYLNLPLPHQENQLAIDVNRLRASLSDIDAYLAMVSESLAAALPTAARGAADGVCPLDAQGLVPAAHLPEVLFGAVKYQGSWDASTNTPAIPAASADNKGHYYLVSVAGSTTIDGESGWVQGDWIVSNGTTWDRIANSEVFDASAIASGVFALARIPALDQSRIPALPISQVTGLQGALDARMPLAGGNFSGNFGIYNTSPTVMFYDTDWGPRQLHCNSGLVGFLNSGGGWAVYSDNDGNLVASGNVGAYSDRKHKKRIRPIKSAIDLIKRLRGVRYTDKRTGAERVGVIAQEVQEHLPEVVGKGKDGLHVDYGNIVAPLIEAVKELDKRLAKLEGR